MSCLQLVQDQVDTIRSICIGISAHQKLELLSSLVKLLGYESLAVFGDCFDEVSSRNASATGSMLAHNQNETRSQLWKPCPMAGNQMKWFLCCCVMTRTHLFGCILGG